MLAIFGRTRLEPISTGTDALARRDLAGIRAGAGLGSVSLWRGDSNETLTEKEIPNENQKKYSHLYRRRIIDGSIHLGNPLHRVYPSRHLYRGYTWAYQQPRPRRCVPD